MKLKQVTALLTATVLLLTGCSGFGGKRNLTYTDALFDTVISVKILDIADEELLTGCKEICQKYDTLFSKTNEESEIYKINHAKGKAVEVSKDTITIIEKGIYYSKMSNGAFDITIGSVSNLWDFKEAYLLSTAATSELYFAVLSAIFLSHNALLFVVVLVVVVVFCLVVVTELLLLLLLLFFFVVVVLRLVVLTLL